MYYNTKYHIYISLYNCFNKKLANSDSNNYSLITHIISLPGFETSKARFVKQHSTTARPSPEKLSLEIVPTAAELLLPWRRDRSYQSFGTFG